jgi:hypothetical protein
MYQEELGSGDLVLKLDQCFVVYVRAGDVYNSHSTIRFQVRLTEGVLFFWAIGMSLKIHLSFLIEEL